MLQVTGSLVEHELCALQPEWQVDSRTFGEVTLV